MGRLLVVLWLVLGLVACDRVASPSDAFLIPAEEVHSVTGRAESGDMPAIRRLIAHYDASSYQESMAERWRGEARRLGDPDELYYHAARLETAARAERNPVTREALLHEALQSATRAEASRKDTSTKELVRDIMQALDTKPMSASGRKRTFGAERAASSAKVRFRPRVVLAVVSLEIMHES